MTPESPPPNAALFFDVDGTLIEFAPTPDTVHVPSSLLNDLTAAERICSGALALVSGRSIAQLDTLFAPKRFTASGVHGAEFRLADGKAWTEAKPIPDFFRDEVRKLAQAFPASLIEDKNFSMAVHYRAAPDTGPRLRKALESALSARRDLGLTLLPGNLVFELKRLGIDKGGAITKLMDRAPFKGRSPIFIGDDVTDLPGFIAVDKQGGYGYSVGREMSGAHGMFADPKAVRAWLHTFVHGRDAAV